MEIALGIALVVLAIVLIGLVLLQSGKDTQLSGTIAGGAETFFGKSKATTMERRLSVLTVAVSIIFAILVLVVYAMFG